MSDVAIRVEGISKQYRIGEANIYTGTLRDALTRTAAAPLARLRTAFRRGPERRNASEGETIWALRDVSLDIKQGEVVGVIGRNGAGKSTLLKILARITEPTRGLAEIRGRVGSLLEVGTGFHYELTGRENIYLSGAILGMKRGEIDRKFEEMVEFAEVSKFIDTPVKHYSSGMHLRLAFSVAAHLEPEVLLVDEVLAVGDVAFQKKCMGKMDDVATQGRTVLFVSHNLGVIKELCQTSIVLDNGALQFRGPVVEGLTRYSQSITEDACGSQSGGGWRSIRINGQPNGLATTVAGHDPLHIEAWLDAQDVFNGGRLFCIVNDSVGNVVVHQRVNSQEVWHRRLGPGRYRIAVELPPLWLAPGVYTLYFKFIGNNEAGLEGRYLSERAMLDVIGSVNSLGRAHLAPPVRWTLTAEPQPEAREVMV